MIESAVMEVRMNGIVEDWCNKNNIKTDLSVKFVKCSLKCICITYHRQYNVSVYTICEKILKSFKCKKRLKFISC